jgi:signal peptidase
MSARTVPAPVAWAFLVARTLAAAAVTLTIGLAAWSVLPRVAGWSPSVVMTGSMEPRLNPGDVVLSAPATAHDVHPGQVVLVRNPAVPSRMLMHRFVHWNDAGDLVTKGDANPHEDSTPVPPGNVRGLPRLRLPYIGLGVVWLHNRDWRHLGFAALAVLAALGLLSGGPTLEDLEGAGDDEESADAAEPVLDLTDHPGAAPGAGPDPDSRPFPDPRAAPQSATVDEEGPTRKLPDRDPATGRFISSRAGR